MEAARTSETLVNFYQTARRYNPEGSHLHTRRRENLKSISKMFFSHIPCTNVIEDAASSGAMTSSLAMTSLRVRRDHGYWRHHPLTSRI
jgi:hypothetical protein